MAQHGGKDPLRIIARQGKRIRVADTGCHDSYPYFTSLGWCDINVHQL